MLWGLSKRACQTQEDGRLTFDGISSGTIRMACTDMDGHRHTFNPLSHWYMLSNVEVPQSYSKVWKQYTDNFAPPPDKVVTVRPCPERYLSKADIKRMRDPNSPDKTLALSPSGRTHFEEGMLGPRNFFGNSYVKKFSLQNILS